MKRELSVVLGLLVCSQGFAAAVPSISENIDLSLATNLTVDSYAEWKDSGNTPEDVFAKVEQLDTPAAWSELCAKLSSLPADDLALFDHEINHDGRSSKMKCRATLARRLRAYWDRASKALTIEHDGESMDLMPISFQTMPNEVRVVETSKSPVFFNGDLKHGEIGLTFDDGPHPTRTQKILDTLAANGIRATFFEVGEMAKRRPQLSRAEIAAGHTVGSHTWNHPNLPRLPLAAAEHNILLGHDTVMNATGVETPFFRFPYGARDKTLQLFVQGLHMASFFWNMDSQDWKLRNPSDLFRNVVKELDREQGGIILFHDIQEQTTIVLPHFIEVLKQRGFKTIVFVPQPPQPPLQ